jgi:hypothetical protein
MIIAFIAMMLAGGSYWLGWWQGRRAGRYPLRIGPGGHVILTVSGDVQLRPYLALVGPNGTLDIEFIDGVKQRPS